MASKSTGTQVDITYRTNAGATAHATVTARPGGYAIKPSQVGPDCAAILTVGPARNAAADARNAAHAAAIAGARR